MKETNRNSGLETVVYSVPVLFLIGFIFFLKNHFSSMVSFIQKDNHLTTVSLIIIKYDKNK